VNEEFEFSLASRKRKLSRFLCQELFYDYIEGQLDDDREKAMADFLKSNKDVKNELAAIQNGFDYSKRLSEIAVSDAVVENIRNYKSGLEYLIDRLAWKRWPDTLRWGIEAVAISAVVALAFTIIPVKSLKIFLPSQDPQVVLTEVAGSHDQMHVVTPDDIDEESETPVPPRQLPTPAPTALENTMAPTLAPPSIAAMKPVPKTEQNLAAGDDAREESEENIGGETLPKEATARRRPQGFVYRAFMSSQALEATTGQVREFIEIFGGERAGKVELGWRKPTGSYFHFSMPDSNYEQLLGQLRNLGPVRIYKDPHWRVMPEGRIRIILFVEDVSH